MSDPRRNTPRADVVLADPRMRTAEASLGRNLVKDVVTGVLDQVRRGELPPDAAVDAAILTLPATAASLRGVINATGVLVHTNLGRAPLSDAAISAVQVAAGYTNVELDLSTGRRARRGEGVLAALREAVPDAQAVHVVNNNNNNAAALALLVAALAAGREVLISRGEFVEVGDGFRIPELLCVAGARLREVGTTNRTRLSDYGEAIGSETALVLKLHPSNFAVTGFTSSVPVAALATLGVPVVHDIGSGLLAPEPALPDEPDAATSLRAGAALVTASGDKLLGGPQAGLLFGRADLVERIRRHPLARAVRVDKLTLAALEATIRGPQPPVRAALHADLSVLRSRAARLADRLRTQYGIDAQVIDSTAVVGGGGAPDVTLRSVAVSLPGWYAERLRAGRLPVVGRIAEDRCLLDLRTVPEAVDSSLLSAIAAAQQ